MPDPRHDGGRAGRRRARAAGVARRLCRGGDLDRSRQPREAAHRLQGLDRVGTLQDDDDRARQVEGRGAVPPRQRQPRLRDGHHRRRTRDVVKSAHRLRSRHRRERPRRDGARRGVLARGPRVRRASASQERARVDGAPALLADRRADRRGDGQEHLRRRDGHQRHRPTVESARAVPGGSEDPLDRRARSHRGQLRQRRRHRQRGFHHATPGREDRHEAHPDQRDHRLRAQRR